MGWGAAHLALLCLLLAVWAPDVRGKIAADQHWGPVTTCLLIFSLLLMKCGNFTFLVAFKFDVSKFEVANPPKCCL